MAAQWDETVDAHRRDVCEAVIRAAATLVAERGLRAATMSDIAQAAGIGRATLYRYFPDAQAILLSWHEREISAHLQQLTEIRDRTEPAERLRAVLEGYASLSHRSHAHDAELAAALHRDPQVGAAGRRVRALLRAVLAEGVEAGTVRDDIATDELAAYCVSALNAAAEFPSNAAVSRLVAVTVAGLRP